MNDNFSHIMVLVYSQKVGHYALTMHEDRIILLS